MAFIKQLLRKAFKVVTKEAVKNGRKLGKVFVGAKRITVKELKQRIEAGELFNRAKKGSSKAPHGNSKASTKPQHGYEISEKATGDVAKTGISGQPLNKDGTSPRANSQVNKWNKEAGHEKYEADVVKPNMPDRQTALDWEKDNAQRLWEEGNSMNKHQRPKPWED